MRTKSCPWLYATLSLALALSTQVSAQRRPAAPPAAPSIGAKTIAIARFVSNVEGLPVATVVSVGSRFTEIVTESNRFTAVLSEQQDPALREVAAGLVSRDVMDSRTVICTTCRELPALLLIGTIDMVSSDATPMKNLPLPDSTVTIRMSLKVFDVSTRIMVAAKTIEITNRRCPAILPCPTGDRTTALAFSSALKAMKSDVVDWVTSAVPPRIVDYEKTDSVGVTRVTVDAGQNGGLKKNQILRCFFKGLSATGDLIERPLAEVKLDEIEEATAQGLVQPVRGSAAARTGPLALAQRFAEMVAAKERPIVLCRKN